MEKDLEKKEERLKDFANTLFQNTQTALQSIDEILKLTEDEGFKKELYREKELYINMKNEIIDECYKLSVKPDDNNFMEKARLWSSIKMTTIMDKSTRHLAEMMLLGTVMGTLTCYKDLSDYKGINIGLYGKLEKLMGLEEENFNYLKKFLKEL